MQLNKKNKITTTLGTYHRAMETTTNIFFINFDEKNIDMCCKTFDRKMKLVSETNLGYNTYLTALKTGGYSWLSKLVIK